MNQPQHAGQFLNLFHTVSVRRAKVLFVCLGNSCRSQMAEAFARTYGSDVLEAASVGLVPSSRISPETWEVMEEVGISLKGQRPKRMREVRPADFDLIVNLTEEQMPIGGASCLLHWPVADPLGKDDDYHREVRDRIDWLARHLVLQFRMARTQNALTASNTGPTGYGAEIPTFGSLRPIGAAVPA